MTGKITGGVYLVLDMRHSLNILLDKLVPALKAGLAAVQVWGDDSDGAVNITNAGRIISLCHASSTPVFISNNWEMLNICDADGVHFDSIPASIGTIKTLVKRAFSFGITSGNDFATIEWAHNNNAAYISFCAMFPTETAASCEIVMPQSVQRAKDTTNLPVFVSGGITPANTTRLKEQTDFDGVAVVSGILHAADPFKEVIAYKNALKKNV